MKEFTTAVKEHIEEEVGLVAGDLTWLQDGRPCLAHRPTAPQIAFAMAATTRRATYQDQVAAVLNFLADCLDNDESDLIVEGVMANDGKTTYEYVTDRLLDRKDDYGLEEMLGLMYWFFEEWSGRSLGSPPVFSGSPPGTGQKSPEPTPASTS